MFLGAVVILHFATILTTTVFGLNELFEAIEEGNEARVLKLLETKKSAYGRSRSYNVNSMDYFRNQTPLNFAIARKQENIAEILIKKGANGRPLQKAINARMEKLVKLILELDADLDVNKEITFLFGLKRASTTFIHEAATSGKAAIVKMICDKGANLEKINYCNFTPLQCAIHHNVGVEIVRILLERGANVNGTNHKLDTALHFAVRYPKNKDKDNRREIMDLLLSVEGVNIEAVNICGYTPLLEAAGSYANVEYMRALLSAGANIHARDICQRTILHYPRTRGNEIIINLAKCHGFDFERRDDNGDTPFLYSARHKDADAMRILGKAGANVNVFNKEKKGAIQYAVEAYVQPAEMVEISLFYGANLDFPNDVNLDLRLLDRRCEKGRLVRNKLLEAGFQLSREKCMEFLKVYWPPCYEIVKNGKFSNFGELFREVTEAFLKNDLPGNGGLMNLLSEYELRGAFALFKILKTIRGKEPETDLERRKSEIVDYAVMRITKGRPYLKNWPLVLSRDILFRNVVWRWKLETWAFHLALAYDELNISMDQVKIAMKNIIFNYSNFISNNK